MKIIYLSIICLLITINTVAQQKDNSTYAIAKKHTIFSKLLNQDREIFIYVPEGFWELDKQAKNYPTVFVLDGESQFLSTVSSIDFLSAAPLGNDLMPRMIIVGIPNIDRNKDLTPKKGMIGNDSTTLAITGGGKNFLKFITSELIPYIDQQFPTSSHRTIIGHSLGGLMVFEALLHHREFFNNYLAIDPGFSYDRESCLPQILDSLRQANLKEENLFIAKANTLPTFLTLDDIENDSSEVVTITRSNQKFLQLARSENWNINYVLKEFPNENHFSIPYLATAEGMKFFYNFYPFKEMIDYYHPAYKTKSDLVAKLKKHYQLISEKMGFEVMPMESYINSWAYGFNHFGRTDLSIDLFDYNIDLYPKNPSVYNSKGFFMLQQKNTAEAIKLFESSLSLKEDEFIRKKLDEIKQ